MTFIHIKKHVSLYTLNPQKHPYRTASCTVDAFPLCPRILAVIVAAFPSFHSSSFDLYCSARPHHTRTFQSVPLEKLEPAPGTGCEVHTKPQWHRFTRDSRWPVDFGFVVCVVQTLITPGVKRVEECRSIQCQCDVNYRAEQETTLLTDARVKSRTRRTMMS